MQSTWNTQLELLFILSIGYSLGGQQAVETDTSDGGLYNKLLRCWSEGINQG